MPVGTQFTTNLARRRKLSDRLLDYKEAANIVNTGTALLAMAEIMEAWLAEHNAGERDESKKPGSRD